MPESSFRWGRFSTILLNFPFSEIFYSTFSHKIPHLWLFILSGIRFRSAGRKSIYGRIGRMGKMGTRQKECHEIQYDMYLQRLLLKSLHRKEKKYYFTLLVFPFIFPNMHGNEWMNEWNEGKSQRRKNQIMTAYNRMGVCITPIFQINYPRAYCHRANLNMNWTPAKDLEVLTSSVWSYWHVVLMNAIHSAASICIDICDYPFVNVSRIGDAG